MRIQQHIFNEEKQRHHDKQKRAKAKRHRPKAKRGAKDWMLLNKQT